MAPRPVLSLLLSLLVVHTAVSAQATVSRIVASDSSSTDSTSDVTVTPFGAVRAENLRVGTELAFGDELRSKSGGTAVVLQCSDSAEVTLDKAFRAVIVPPSPGESCFLNLSAGEAHTVATAKTGVEAGDVTLGSKSTHYVVRISRVGNSVQRDLEVFDGEVVVHPVGQTDTVDVSAGRWLALSRHPGEPTRIASQQAKDAADLYARIDASAVARQKRKAITATLASAYRTVLMHPDSAAPRVRLAGEQVTSGVSSKITLYQLARAQAIAPHSRSVKIATTALMVATYHRMGQATKAETEFARLRNVDSTAIDSAFVNLRINPTLAHRLRLIEFRRTVGGAEAISRYPITVPAPDTLRIRVAASPVSTAAGKVFRIVVRVVTRNGAAVPGARVSLEVGGGSFTNGRTTILGTTDDEGVLRVAWSCRACAAAYQVGVAATKEGFVKGRTSFRVTIRGAPPLREDSR